MNAVTIPFTRRLGHILVDARVNGAPATLILDTGSGACSLDETWARDLHLTPGPTAKAVGVGDMKVALATAARIHIGDGVELVDEMVALAPFAGVSAVHGVAIHGTIGFSFFLRYVVEIDYEANVLRLGDPASYEYRGPGESIPIDLSKRVPVLVAQLVTHDGAVIPTRLVLDIGTSAFGAILTSPFVEQNAASLFSGPFIERALGTGIGGSASGRVARLEELRLGSLTVPHPIVGMPSHGGGFFGSTWVDGTVGATILARMRVICDYAHSRVILEPGEGADAPFEFDASGLTLRAGGESFGAVTIEAVAPGSAGARAGIIPGDALLAVDGRIVSGETIPWVTEQFMSAGETRALSLRRDDREWVADLRLAPFELP